jgi:phosphate transport system permease protein
MSTAATLGKGETASTAPAMRPPSRFGDRIFTAFTFLMAATVVVLICLVGWQLWAGAQPAVHQFGAHFLVSTDWDPGNDVYGALPFIYGTLVSSLLALIIAVPLSVATAIYLTELAPLWLRQPVVSLIEMLAAIPSVILGLWGIFVMVPWLRVEVLPFLRTILGAVPGGISHTRWIPFFWTPFFQGSANGPCMLAGGMIIAIMIIPIITSVSREILISVPHLQREAAYALGATRWEVTRIAVLSYAKRGIFGAVILGLGRALGETMAVTMVIGNTPQITASLFAPGYTLASVIANEFAEATSDLCVQSLFEIGLVLFLVTIIVNLLAQIVLKTFAGATVKQ